VRAGYAHQGERAVIVRSESFAAVAAPPEFGIRDLVDGLAAAV
jgi:hypothetical protein